MLISKRIEISEDFFNLLKIHFNQEYEVGGVMFAYKRGFKIILDTISFKKGHAMHIDFTEEDLSLFEVPKKYYTIGTWHTHPFQNIVKASIIDLNQWKKWNEKYIHLIYNGKEIKIYTSKGEIMYEQKIKKDNNKYSI